MKTYKNKYKVGNILKISHTGVGDTSFNQEQEIVLILKMFPNSFCSVYNFTEKEESPLCSVWLDPEQASCSCCPKARYGGCGCFVANCGIKKL
jgi:hypothetical protein